MFIESSSNFKFCLQVGDEIVRVNGYNIKRATHSEVIAALSISKIVKLKVRR